MWATYNLSYLYVDIQENGTADLVNLGNDALISAYGSSSVDRALTYFELESLCQDDFEDLLNVDRV